MQNSILFLFYLLSVVSILWWLYGSLFNSSRNVHQSLHLFGFYLMIRQIHVFESQNKGNDLIFQKWVNSETDHDCISKVVVPMVSLNCQQMNQQGSLYVPIQGEMASHCNAISHWLGACTEWSPKQEHDDQSPSLLIAEIFRAGKLKLGKDGSPWYLW